MRIIRGYRLTSIASTSSYRLIINPNSQPTYDFRQHLSRIGYATITTLFQHKVQWKYLINLCGQDFPLKTNAEMVAKLRGLMPFNSVESISMPLGKMGRYEYIHTVTQNALAKTVRKKLPPPHGMRLFAGSAYVVVTREFVQWVMENSTVRDILDWSKDTYSPDEMLWASLVRFPGAPGFRHFDTRWDTNELQDRGFIDDA